MVQNVILLPVFAQVALTFAVLIALGRARARSMKTRGQRLDDMVLSTDADWERAAVQASNNYKNQFEMPVLFYAVCGFALATRLVDPLLLALACLFVVTRIVHAVIHIAYNRIQPRGLSFLLGVAALVAMWIILGWRVVQAGVF